MSERRYKMMTTIIDPFPIWDTVEEKGYNCTDTLELLVELLNNLTEENEQLKQTIQKIADSDGLTVEELFESVKDVPDEVIMQYLRIFYD